MRLAFFNIQSGVGVTRGYWQFALRGHRYLLPHDDAIVAGVSRFVVEEAIDVLGCAEIEGPSIRSSSVDYTARLAATSPLSHAQFFPSRRVGRWIHQGNSIHARAGLVATRVHALPGPGEPRILGEAEVDHEGVRYAVFVTHLSLAKRARQVQIARIAEIVTPRAHAVLMGDFNTADTAELAPVLAAGWQRAAIGPTHPSWAPAKAIDHVLVSPDLAIRSARAVATVLIADHLPVVVEAGPR